MPRNLVAQSTFTIRNFTEIPRAERVHALQIPDFLERLPHHGTGNEVDDTYQSVYVAYPADAAEGSLQAPVGRITVFRRSLLAHRSPANGMGTLLSAGLVEFPVTAYLDIPLWDALLNVAYAQLRAQGMDTVGTYLPPECSAHTAYLEEHGFERLAESDRLVGAQFDAFQPRTYLYVRRLDQPAPHRPDAYPISPAVNLMRTANAAMALQPESASWAAVRNYSGYSGYAWLTSLLDQVLDSPRRLLSIPAGTGDTIRLLPKRVLQQIDSCTGIDILDRNIAFARARHRAPYIDILNQLVAGSFLEARLTGQAAPTMALLGDLCACAGRPLTGAEAVDLYVELRAVAEEALVCGGIADWFALTKGIGRFLEISPQPAARPGEPDAESALASCVTLAEAVSYQGITELAQRHGSARLVDAELLDLLEKKTSNGNLVFDSADMFGFRSSIPFDTVFVWEAALIVARAGRQNDFVTMVNANLTDGGNIVMTGIRREDGGLGRDLEIVSDEFRRHGYAISQTLLAPPTDRWARSCLDQPVFPVLFATKPHRLGRATASGAATA